VLPEFLMGCLHGRLIFFNGKTRSYMATALNTQKYSVNQHLIETILAWVKSGEIAIPEIQRPFVWDSTKVRDLMDSLYQGFPVGYIIVWKNPDIRLKDGNISEGKKILIDGQQRVTALRAAIVGEYVINKEYKSIKIKISCKPQRHKQENSSNFRPNFWGVCQNFSKP
jgi:uncharacterized protein with ParB-like and HNH nuclease domain